MRTLLISKLRELQQQPELERSILSTPAEIYIRKCECGNGGNTLPLRLICKFEYKVRLFHQRPKIIGHFAEAHTDTRCRTQQLIIQISISYATLKMDGKIVFRWHRNE